ncbi:YhfC family glutamic-type intramembrane protease [Caproicibacterium sp. BJN0003]|uniref:YhfC family glutamic-type intramembrane protease n=1 Tax=Caproicibacterium sp. BJN0003 TaxID=2994078 RepID=UPI002253763F|nr:YhfC family glutamic-type intramembrane protease [Caproicibacterium sp. BJN0003]UZT82491.1 YhfC family glutamic-type intramembrane protease [Caproicibacterium sp. BJN0003]
MIPSINIAGMGFILLASLVLPFGLYFYFYARLRHFRIYPVVFGLAAYLLFGYAIESIMGQQLLSVLNAFPTTNPTLYVVTILLMAGLIEGSGMLTSAFLLRWKICRDETPASEIGIGIGFGIAFGGLKSALEFGLYQISTLRVAAAINSQGIDNLLQNFTDDEKILAQEQIQAIANTQPYLYFITGIEQIFMISLQIALAVLVWMVITRRLKWYFFPIAIVLHMFALLPTTLSAINALDLIVAEVLFALIVIAVVFLTYWLYKKYWDSVPPITEQARTSGRKEALSSSKKADSSAKK